MELLHITLLCLCGGAWAMSPPLEGMEENNSTVPKPMHYFLQHQLRTSFKKLYVHFGGRITSTHSSETIEVAATSHVSDLAHQKAAHIVSLMVRHMPHDVFQGVTRSHGVGLFTKAETIGVYPENYHLRDTPQCAGNCHGSCAHTCSGDGRKYSTMGGLTNSRSVILDDIVLCNSHDTHGHTENIVVHEFGHLVLRYSPSSIQDRVKYVYNYAHQHHVWTLNTYGMSNHDEYWAEATQAFFHATKRLDGVVSGMNECSSHHVCSSEAANRQFLHQRDPWLYDQLSHVYTNGNPSLPGGLAPCV